MELTGPGTGPLSYLRLFLFLNLLVLSEAVALVPAPTVRILVEENRSTISLEGFDVLIKDVVESEDIFSSNGRAKVDFKCNFNGSVSLSMGKFLKKSLGTFKGPLHISSQGGFLRVEAKQYRDDLYLYSQNGECRLVNHIDLEKYVAGLLAAEMSPAWNLETLKAQAIAARTYAIFQMKEGGAQSNAKNPFFDLYSTVKDQVYSGADKESYRAIQAVQNTQGQVLSYKGRPIKAYYHSTCGGETIEAEKVWGAKTPYIRPVKCGFCNYSPVFRWVYKASLFALEGKLRKHGIIQERLNGLRVASLASTQRAALIEIVDGNTRKNIKAIKLRDIVGTTDIKSTMFRVFREGDEFRFLGTGSGHGVGMCQWGAKYMGDRGFSSSDILKRYYPLAKVIKIY